MMQNLPALIKKAKQVGELATGSPAAWVKFLTKTPEGRKLLMVVAGLLLGFMVLAGSLTLAMLVAITGGGSSDRKNPDLRASGVLAYNAEMPNVAVDAYNLAAAWAAGGLPSCHIDAAYLAAESKKESDHAAANGGVLANNGDVRTKSGGYIIGPRVADKFYWTDHDDGKYDFDLTQDLATGPFQFMPTTWTGLDGGADGNGDGISDPHNLFDAAIGAVKLLCFNAPGHDLAGDDAKVAASDAYSGRTAGYAADVLEIYHHYLTYLSGTVAGTGVVVKIDSDTKIKVLADLEASNVPDQAKVAVRFAIDHLGEPRGCYPDDPGNNGRICQNTGNHGPASWDCSGLTGGAWISAGVPVVQYTGAMESLPRVPGGSLSEMLGNLRFGDLVLYDWGGDGSSDHVAMFLEDDLVIESTGGTTIESAAVKFTVRGVAGRSNFIHSLHRPGGSA
jgi:cell wall-associated NlpC family hydrolase